MNRARGLMLFAFVLHPGRAGAQKAVLPLPPVPGFSIVQTLSFSAGDRESVHTVDEASASGLRWSWRLVEVHDAGDTVQSTLHYVELLADIADAMRIRIYHERQQPEQHPGYTMHALSRAMYRRLRDGGSDSIQVMSVETTTGTAVPASFGVGGSRTPVRWRGTLTVVTPSPIGFPLLVNGSRVEVPALRLRGHLAARDRKWEPEIWVLADSTYPLLLKWIGAYNQPGNVLQTVRVDLPTGLAEKALEETLASTCRAELPGIYFTFNSAVLDSASHRTIASLGAMLSRHADWKVTLEGHTDSIGSGAANRLLSERRVEAVRARLVSAYRVDGARLKTSGFGSAKPRESNATIEGRARNRRVELVRECARS